GRMLEREQEELKRRLARWYETLESGRANESDGLERIRELRTKHAEVSTVLDRVRQLHSVPPFLYRQDTIDRFVLSLRNAFLSENTAVARVYLRQLIERISIAPTPSRSTRIPKRSRMPWLLPAAPRGLRKPLAPG